MDDSSIPYETTWDLWINQVALLGMTTVFFFLTYIRLETMKKTR